MTPVLSMQHFIVAYLLVYSGCGFKTIYDHEMMHGQ